MKNYFRISLYWTILIVVSGCSSSMSPSPSMSKIDKRPGDQNQSYASTPKIADSGNSYYDFTEAELLQKKGNYTKAIEYLMLAIDQDPKSIFLKRELAILFLKLKNHEQALKVVENILEYEPKDVEALIMLGSIKQTLKSPEEAKSAYEKALALDPRREQIYLLLGRLYMEDKQDAKALKTFQQLIDQFPNSYIGYYYLGKLNALQGALATAEADYLKTLKLEPELLEPRFELISLYQNEKDDYQIVTVIPGDSLNYLSFKHYNKYNETIKHAIIQYNPILAESDILQVGQKLRFPSLSQIAKLAGKETKDEKIIRLYNKILDLNPDNVRAAVELGLYFHHHLEAAKAQEMFEELGVRSTSEQNIVRYIIQYLFEQKKYQNTVTVLNGMLRGAPDNSELHYIIGLAYDNLQQEKKMVDHFQHVTPESRYYANAMIQTALIMQENGKHEEAIQLLESAAAKKPKDVEILLYLGSIYEELENFPKAESIYLQGAALNPKFKRIHYRLGVTYDKWGQKEDSIKEMKVVIQLDPKDSNALNYLGYTYADMGIHLEEAEHLVKEALKYKPDDGYITDSLGWVYYKQGKLKKAIELLEKAVTLVSDDPILLEHLGDAYLKNSNKKKALDYYKRALLLKKDKKAELEKKIKEIDAIADNHH